jgi:hypothetical protein
MGRDRSSVCFKPTRGFFQVLGSFGRDQDVIAVPGELAGEFETNSIRPAGHDSVRTHWGIVHHNFLFSLDDNGGPAAQFLNPNILSRSEQEIGEKCQTSGDRREADEDSRRMPGSGFLSAGAATIHCGGFASGALQCKTLSLTILVEPPRLGTEAS